MTQEEFFRRYTFVLFDGQRVLNNAFVRQFKVSVDEVSKMTIDQAYDLAKSRE